MSGSLALEFLEFIDSSPHYGLRRLTRQVLSKCRQIARAQAGTIYLVRGKGHNRQLEAMCLQNDAVRAASKLFVFPVSVTSIAGYVATTGETVFVDDVYNLPPGVPYRFNAAYDQKTGYRTRSTLCFPLQTADGKTIGVVQLINRQSEPGPDGKTEAVAFEPRFREVVGPVSLIVGRAIERVNALEQIAERNRRLSQRNRELQAERERVVLLSSETERAFMLSAELLARAAEIHDQETGDHIMRVNGYSLVLSRLAGMRKEFCSEISWAAALHDVGKMSVDSAVLHKKGRLDAREFAEMQAHTTYGHRILHGHPRLALAAEIAHCHHEMWQGGGYPRGLAGEAIPVAARIVALADVYDALRSTRPYKVGFDHQRAVEIMTEGDDRMHPAAHFDPKLLRLFSRHHEQFAEVWDGFAKAEPAKLAPP